MTDTAAPPDPAPESHITNVTPRSAYVRAAMLGGFAEVVKSAGGNVADMLAHAAIPVRALQDPDMVISWTAVGTLMDYAAEKLDKPSIGLEWLRATPEPLLSFGAIALIARFTTTIGDWCHHSRSYWHWHTNACHAELLESGDTFTLRVSFAELVPSSRHQVEYIFGGVCLLLDILAPLVDKGIEVVRFRHPRPADVSLLEALFPCPVEFGCEYNDLVYGRALHEHSINLPPNAATRWLERYVEARTWTIPGYDGTTRAKVEIAIPSLIGTSFCTQPHIAALLSISPKMLQRQLTKEKVRFIDLLDKTRERMALQLLKESDVPIASIAGLLGYANTPPFTAAVHRWTAQSPRQFRDLHR